MHLSAASPPSEPCCNSFSLQISGGRDEEDVYSPVRPCIAVAAGDRRHANAAAAGGMRYSTADNGGVDFLGFHARAPDTAAAV